MCFLELFFLVLGGKESETSGVSVVWFEGERLLGRKRRRRESKEFGREFEVRERLVQW